VRDLDAPTETKRLSGAELMTNGLLVTLPHKPQAALLTLEAVGRDSRSGQ